MRAKSTVEFSIGRQTSVEMKSAGKSREMAEKPKPLITAASDITARLEPIELGLLIKIIVILNYTHFSSSSHYWL